MKKITVIVLVFGALYMIGGSLIFPIIIKRDLTALIATRTDQILSIERVRFNPISLTAELRGLDLAAGGATPLLTIDSAVVKFHLRSLAGRTWPLRELRLDHPRLSFSKGDNATGLKALFEALTGADGPAVAVTQFTVHHGEVRIDAATAGDRFPAENLVFSDLELQMQNLSTAPESRSDFTLSTGIDHSARLTAGGYLGLHEHRLEAAVSLIGFNITALGSSAEFLPGAEITAGLLSADLQLVYENDRANIKGEFELEQVKLVDKTSRAPVFAGKKVIGSGLDISTAPLRARLGKVELINPVLKFTRDPQLSAAPPQWLRVWTDDAAVFIPGVDHLEITDGRIDFNDSSVSPPLKLAAHEVNGTIRRGPQHPQSPQASPEASPEGQAGSPQGQSPQGQARPSPQGQARPSPQGQARPSPQGSPQESPEGQARSPHGQSPQGQAGRDSDPPVPQGQANSVVPLEQADSKGQADPKADSREPGGDSGGQAGRRVLRDSQEILSDRHDGESRTTLSIEARINTTGFGKLSGSFVPHQLRKPSDLNLELRQIEASILSPYTTTWLGRNIESGSLSVSLRWLVRNGIFQLDNTLLIDALRLGNSRKTPGAEMHGPVQMPIELAVAVLTDPDKRINVSIPVPKGPLNAEVSIATLVGDSVIDFLKSITNSPFATLSALVEAPDEVLQFIDFEPGSAALKKSATRKLGMLHRALEQRPGLNLQVTPRYHAIADRNALSRQQMLLHIALATGAAATGQAGGFAGSPTGTLDFNDSKVQSVVEEFATARLSPSQLDGLRAGNAAQSSDYYASAFETLVAFEQVPGSALRRLARFRAQTIIDALTRAGTDVKRLSIENGVTVTEDKSEVLAVELSLHPTDVL